MVRSAPGGQLDLVLAFPEAGPVLVGVLANAAGAGDTGFEMVAVFVARGKGAAAGVAKVIFAFLKPMTHRNPLIEDKALTFPEALLFRHVLKILQNATF